MEFSINFPSKSVCLFTFELFFDSEKLAYPSSSRSLGKRLVSDYPNIDFAAVSSIILVLEKMSLIPVHECPLFGLFDFFS